MKTLTSPIDLIVVKDRFRRDLGDLSSLRDSIKSIGLLHPVVVDGERKLIAGQRRLEACKQLGWKTIDVRVADSIDSAAGLLAAERDENTCRKEMTPLEMKALVDALLEIERPKAAERVGGRPPKGTSETCVHESTGFRAPGSVQRAAETAGTSRATYERISHVVEVATDADEPEEVRAVAAEQIVKLEAGETTPGAADRAVREAAGRPLKTKPKPPPSKQLNRNHVIRASVAMGRVLPQLNGITSALASIDFSHADAQEAKDWCLGLRAAIQVLKSTVKRIEDQK